jgi:5-methylcytosine-specific restriction enzyme subunit McrC
MKTYRQHITVYEHERIKLDQLINGYRFDAGKLLALQKFYGNNGVPYYSLIHNGVQFNKFVGVIQVGNLLIEVLPKADKIAHSEPENKKWRNILIDMMRTVGSFDVKVTSSSHLKIKPNTVLDLYIEMFINEVEYLLHAGLIKQYRKKEENQTALKGNILFRKQIQQNLTHQERFYVCHSTYDAEHQLHIIIYTAIRFIKQINTNASLHSRIGALMLFFPELPTIRVTEATFEKIVYNRKSEGYRKAIEIAKLLLLQYHPDISKGRNHVLALMFDMNRLWEQFVYVSLRKYATDWNVSAQLSRDFWKPEVGYKTRIRPDIVLQHKTDKRCIVLDTKWKNLSGYSPTPDDLRQMYVYNEYFNAYKAVLVYPGDGDYIKGSFLNKKTSERLDNECSIFSISIQTNIILWQKEIFDNLMSLVH